MRRTDSPRGRDVAAGMFLKTHPPSPPPLPHTHTHTPNLPHTLISPPPPSNPPPSVAADAAEGAVFGEEEAISESEWGVGGVEVRKNPTSKSRDD